MCLVNYNVSCKVTAVEITEQALIEEFDRRDIPISKRVLTDWRAKGYLPPLQVKGLGQGKENLLLV